MTLARLRGSSCAAQAGALAVLLSPLLLLTACSFDKQLEPSFCTEYEDSWGDFTSVRDDESATPEAVIEASDELRDRWEDLRISSRAPDDVTGMLGISVSTFTSAWIAHSSADRGSYERSLSNERDYITLRCSEIGVDLQFDGGVAPIEIPRVN